jgi:hypothetical protein
VKLSKGAVTDPGRFIGVTAKIIPIPSFKRTGSNVGPTTKDITSMDPGS